MLVIRPNRAPSSEAEWTSTGPWRKGEGDTARDEGGDGAERAARGRGEPSWRIPKSVAESGPEMAVTIRNRVIFFTSRRAPAGAL